jgi:LEA14-like dessication related protein
VDPRQVEISESNTNSWCSVQPSSGEAFDPYLTFELDSTYLIEIIKISGGNQSHGYVTALTINNDTGQGFVFISDNGIPKVSQLWYNIESAQC